jgi:hypothetical protein
MVIVFPCRHSTIQIIVLLEYRRHGSRHSFALPSHRDWPLHTVRCSTAVSGAFKPDVATVRTVEDPDKDRYLAAPLLGIRTAQLSSLVSCYERR